MPEVYAKISTPWKDGASIYGGLTATPWKDGISIYSLGGAFTPSGATGTPTTVFPILPAFSIPEAKRYLQVNTLVVYDDRDNTVLTKFETFSIKTSADQSLRQLSAQITNDMRVRLLQGEQPAVIRIDLNGAIWRFVVDSISRSRSFPNSNVSLTGSSLTVAASSDYQGERNWIIDGDTTAAQIASVVNAYTGLEIQWNIEDWVIPSGIFSFFGSPLAVVVRLAETVKAIVQSDKSNAVLRVLPRYPVLPNELETTLPDVEIAEDAVTEDSSRRADQPAYNSIYVSGQQSGLIGVVTLAGSNGGFQHPLVTDQFITEEPAIRMRGTAELGASGKQWRVSRELPVIYGAGRPGVLELNQIVRFLDKEVIWSGIVRSVDLNVVFPRISQTVEIEKH